jgi:cytochrome c-type biogenesis protein CcmH/NrfG
MWKRVILSLLLLAAALAPARDKPENWLEIRSQHFTVVTNANDKTGRRIADQFERMRSVFHVAFPRVSIDNGSPIIVLAIKDEKDFRALEPKAYLAKGQLRLGGLFLRAPDKNYVLMRVDAEGEHPYAVVYHEYTHFLLSNAAEWLPLWLNEGLAEFYENTDIHEKDVALGQASEGNLELLRENRLLPLATLFTVDASSPYYHEENKGSIFYAESWALTHYLYIKDHQEKKQRVADYGELLTQKVDPVTAATRVFGDLKQLQSNLEGYIRQGSFSYFKLSTSTEVDDAAFKTQVLTAAQADAVRADFLAYNERAADARPLLDRVLQEDPQNVSARETMGYLEFRTGHLDEARKWYEQAVKLDSQSYLAHYYFAAISMNAGASPSDDAQVEASLRAAIKLNPSFAPSFDRLAAFEGMRHRNLDEAHMMALTATQLDPGNVGYRVNGANVLMQMDRGKDAVAVLRGALRLAKTPEETAMIQNFLMHAEEYATAREQEKERQSRLAGELKSNAQGTGAPADVSDANAEAPEEELPKGPHRFVVGMLQNVQCHTPHIDLTVAAKGKTIALHSGNYYKIRFSTLGFVPKGDLDPCKDLEGKPAKVEYVESSAKPTAYVVAVELHK